MEAPPINLTDAAVVLVILISGLLAFFRGLVHEVLAVISWIGAALATIYGFPYARPYATELITVPLIADMVAGVGIFLVTLVVLSVLTNFVSHRIRHSATSSLSRMAPKPMKAPTSRTTSPRLISKRRANIALSVSA